MIFNGRIWALIIKELLALFRDPRSRLVLIGPPLLQLFLFSYSATLEVKNISVAVYNQDHGVYSTEVIQRIAASPTFTELQYVQSEQQLQQQLANKNVLMAIQFPADFSQKLLSGQAANIQLLLDGRNSNSAQIIHNYVAQIILQYNAELAQQQGKQGLPVVVLTRNWFNENLQHLWYTVPALVGILAGLVALMVTALSVARERELGYFRSDFGFTVNAGGNSTRQDHSGGDGRFGGRSYYFCIGIDRFQSAVCRIFLVAVCCHFCLYFSNGWCWFIYFRHF